MKGIILLEGADAAGKTTLARHFVERHGARYIHSRIWPSMYKYHVAAVRLALKWADHGLVVIDRLHLSELIYGQIYRGQPAYDLGARSFERILARAGTITVLCVPSDTYGQFKRHRANAACEAFSSISRVVATYADLRHGNVAFPGNGYLGQLIRYGDYAARPDVMVYDLDKDGRKLNKFAETVLDRVINHRLHQFSPALSSQHYNFGGHAGTATHLFVGEAVSPKAKTTRWPWCWHDGASAVTWLNRSLHDIGFDETRGIWTNASEADDHLAELLQLGKVVVCLGSIASKRITIPHHPLPHPQYYRRFRSYAQGEYTAMLKRCLT